MVNSASASSASADRGDLTESMNRMGRPSLGGLVRRTCFDVRWPEAEQPGLGPDEILPQLRRPRGVREVAGTDHGHAFAQRPSCEMLEIALLTARTRELRMDVQVRMEHAVAPRPRVHVASLRVRRAAPRPVLPRSRAVRGDLLAIRQRT
jgi:hypothetical protein